MVGFVVGRWRWPLCHVLFSHFGRFFASVQHPFLRSFLFGFEYFSLKVNVFMELE